MNKSEFIDHIAKQHGTTKVEAEKIIDIFTSSVTSSLSENKDVIFTGFGQFYITDITAREGRNPQTGKPIKIAAHKRPMFSAGSKLKEACNKQKSGKK